MTSLWGTITGPSLREAVARIKLGDAKDFQTYLHAKQALVRLGQQKNPGVELEDVVYFRDKMQRLHPEFIDAAEKWADWWEGVGKEEPAEQ